MRKPIMFGFSYDGLKKLGIHYSYEDLVGGKYFFRTVTYHLIGEVKKVVGRFVYMKDSKVVFESGNLKDALTKGTLENAEDVGEVFVNLDSVTDFFPWNHKLN